MYCNWCYTTKGMAGISKAASEGVLLPKYQKLAKAKSSAEVLKHRPRRKNSRKFQQRARRAEHSNKRTRVTIAETDPHFTAVEALRHLNAFKQAATTAFNTGAKQFTTKELAAQVHQRKLYLERSAKTFPQALAKQIYDTLNNTATKSTYCGTALSLPTLRAVSSTQPHTQKFIRENAPLSIQLASFGESSSWSLMITDIWHGSTPPHDVLPHENVADQSAAVLYAASKDTAAIDAIDDGTHALGVPGICSSLGSGATKPDAMKRAQHISHGATSHATHISMATQVAKQSTTAGTAGLFTHLPMGWEQLVDETWARHRYDLQDVTCKVGTLKSTTEKNKIVKEPFFNWLIRHFFHLSIQYLTELALNRDLTTLFEDLKTKGVAVEEIVVRDMRSNAAMFSGQRGRYPCLTEKQLNSFKEAADSDDITWSCLIEDGEDEKNKKNTYLCTLPTLVRDEQQRILFVYLPETMNRLKTDAAFAPMGDFYLSTAPTNDATKTQGDLWQKWKLQRGHVHMGHSYIENAGKSKKNKVFVFVCVLIFWI